MRKDEVVGLIGKQNWTGFLKYINGKSIVLRNGFNSYSELLVREYLESIKPKKKKVKRTLKDTPIDEVESYLEE